MYCVDSIDMMRQPTKISQILPTKEELKELSSRALVEDGKAGDEATILNKESFSGSVMMASNVPAAEESDDACISWPYADIKELAEQFANALQQRTFSPAEIQGFLLINKMDPAQAVRDVAGWRDGLLVKKSNPRSEGDAGVPPEPNGPEASTRKTTLPHTTQQAAPNHCKQSRNERHGLFTAARPCESKSKADATLYPPDAGTSKAEPASASSTHNKASAGGIIDHQAEPLESDYLNHTGAPLNGNASDVVNVGVPCQPFLPSRMPHFAVNGRTGNEFGCSTCGDREESSSHFGNGDENERADEDGDADNDNDSPRENVEDDDEDDQVNGDDVEADTSGFDESDGYDEDDVRRPARVSRHYGLGRHVFGNGRDGIGYTDSDHEDEF